MGRCPTILLINSGRRFVTNLRCLLPTLTAHCALAAPGGRQPLGDVTDLPAMGDVTDLAAMGDVTDLPAMGDVTDLPAMGDVTEPPAMGDVTEPPAMARFVSAEAQPIPRRPPFVGLPTVPSFLKAAAPLTRTM